MNANPLLENLNDAQREAVCAPPCNAIILAGAGSGKTRVLVHRIAWVVREHGCNPHQILAVTFTNKAANEMKHRIETLLSMPLSNMWTGTFHGLSHRLLRTHWKEANLPESFQILDSDDQYRLIRRLQKSLNLDETKWPYKQTQWWINQQKEAGRRSPQAEENASSFFDETLCSVYRLYEENCQQSGLVDFTELLLRALELLESHQDIREHYQQRFRYLLVDEFQDTNSMQYRWLSAFKCPQNTITAVGDDDQSIYSWRGAQVENMRRFQRDFEDTQVTMLEQNYRSTQTILTAANAIIANNSNRSGKKLWTAGATGEKIDIYAAYSDRDETYHIISTIERELSRGRQASDMAILYRSNAQSRILEERLLETGVPYRIYGGQRFFERAEIKDALGYLRLTSNPLDDAAFERIINHPTRGIGNTTLMTVRDYARENQCSLWQAITEICQAGELLTARARSALSNFIQLITQLQESADRLELHELTEHVLTHSGLTELFSRDKSEKGRSRIENLQELVNATEQFQRPENAIGRSLTVFLSQVALDAGDEQASEHSSYVSLMTLHAAKGLEFPVVFISGVEEGLFPHQMSTDQPGGLEEERRLCYVGMTRAMEKLIISYAEVRRLHGQERYCQPSRFLKELPEHCLNHIRPQSRVGRAGGNAFDQTAQEVAGTDWELGQRISHAKFGPGTITNYEGQGESARIEIVFDNCGKKWLVLRYCQLNPI
jgi:DNA helicase II / ATP-dependent DNA helicase PcrA